MISIDSRLWKLTSIATLVAGLAFAAPAFAQWPEKPVTLFVHSGAGSSTDLMARAFAEAAQEVTGQSFVVVVKGKDAMPALQRADADGYTLSTQTRAFLGELATGTGFYKPEQFQWVSRLVGEVPVFAVRADSPYKTFADLVAAAKAAPNKVKLATYTKGSTVWADSLAVAKAAGVEFNVIPFGSSSETVVALLGGNADVATSYPSQMIQAVEAKQARVMFVASAERHPSFPDVPTLKEQGYDLTLSHWRGLVGKQGIPDDVLKQIDEVTQKVVASKTFMDWAKLAGVDIQYQDHTASEESATKEYQEILTFFKAEGLAP